MWTWICISSNSSVWHQLRMNCQLHAADCYSFGTRRYDAGCLQEPFRVRCGAERKMSALLGTEPIFSL